MGIKDQTVEDVNVIMFFVQLLEKNNTNTSYLFSVYLIQMW